MFCVLMGRVGRSGRELPCNSSLIHIHLGVFLFSLRHQPLCPQPATHPPLWSHKWVKSYTMQKQNQGELATKGAKAEEAAQMSKAIKKLRGKTAKKRGRGGGGGAGGGTSGGSLW